MFVLALASCQEGDSRSRDTASPPAHASGARAPLPVEIVMVPPGDEPLQAIVVRERERAEREGRDLLIYVGATWCEPCTRFHEAALRGELDATFPGLRLLELDRDRDEARLEAAGCITRLIPLFARPSADGGCDLARSMSGSIKGPGAVANIAPRLSALLRP